MKLKYITRLSLACGVMITAVAFSGCSGSPKAVQANAAVISSSGVMSTEPSSEVTSDSTLTSSDLVSHSTPSVSSAVMSSGVSSQRPSSNNSNSTSHQAPTTSRPSNGVGSTSRPASTRPASTTPTPRPASQAPASRPVSTAPVQTGVSGKYSGATYGAENQSQYNEILSYAGQVTGRSRYSKSYDFNKGDQSGFADYYKVSYSDDANKVASIIGCFQNSGASGGHGNAYTAYAQGSSNCADDAKAIQAALNVEGYSCKLVWGLDASGTPHMWTSTYFDGAWHQWGRAKFSSGTPAGFTEQGSGYNY